MLHLKMENHVFRISIFLILLIRVFVSSSSSSMEDRKVYIIHMEKSALPVDFTTHHDWYISILSALSPPDEISPTHLYTYKNVLNGFSAVLSKSQLDELERNPGHVATYADTFGKAHTTHTPKFLGLSKRRGLWPKANFGDGVIIGVLDSGIWPESESFNDKGISPVPERWHGICESGVEFNSSNCNRKLIGARKFSRGMKQYGLNISTTDDYDSPRDYWGHGTHTSSTAAGSPVQDANYFGYAKGEATGMAPLARLAMYKVLYLNDTYDSAAVDVLAGLDQAIEDGVDVLSLSLSFLETSFDKNPIAVGTFSAAERGIFVACAAGNNGPHGYTMHNGFPWLTTVGAGTIDRMMAAHIILGNGSLIVTGKSVYPQNLLINRMPLYYGHGNRSKEICDDNSLDPKEVAGKIVFCDFDSDSEGSFDPSETTRAGAAGAIFSTTFDRTITLKPEDFDTPYVVVLRKDARKIKEYIMNTENPVVGVKFQETVLGMKPAPWVAWFSSRGPDREAPWLLKPDLIAPGVDVLAAWAPNKGIAPIGNNYLLSDYALQSGTSMSTPHVAGVAALVKAAHPDWSPAAIRSAMMTTAYVIDNAGRTIVDTTTEVAGTPLDFGAGHIDPEKAIDPGLIYDLETKDYIKFLCGMNYTSKQIKTITGRSNFTCPEASLDINYPSFIIILNDTNTTSFTYKRILTSVVNRSSAYEAVVEPPSNMKVIVEPPTLSFPQKYSKAEFNLTIEIALGESVPQSDYIVNYGFLSWMEINGTHVVRSPLVSAYAP